MPRYIALLRGINVGGNTLVKMTELKAIFEKCGLENVVTYINSGNIAFDHELQKPARSKGPLDTELALTSLIEDAVERKFGKRVQVMVRDQTLIPRIIAANPYDGEYASHKEMHVLFLKDEISADKISLLRKLAPVNERFTAIGREIYCHLPMGVAESLMGRGLIEKKLNIPVTARNWRTVERLAEM